MLSSMKPHFESHSTGRTAVIQGIQTEEQEFVLTVDMAIPGGPATPSPFMKMVMQIWTAKPGEEQRVAVLQEFKNYTAIVNYSMNASEAIKQILRIMPGMDDGLRRHGGGNQQERRHFAARAYGNRDAVSSEHDEANAARSA